MIEVHNYDDIKNATIESLPVLVADESHMMKDENKWTVVMLYPEQEQGVHTEIIFDRWYGQKCGSVRSLSAARLLIENVCKPAFPNNEYVVVPYTEQQNLIPVEHVDGLWTFNAKGEARPAWISGSLREGETKRVRERLDRSDKFKHVRVGDLVRIELTHYGKDDPQYNMVRRVIGVRKDIDYNTLGDKSYGQIEYEIDYAVDKPMSDGSNEYHNSCAIGWITEIIEHARDPLPVINRMHERWKQSQQWRLARSKESGGNGFDGFMTDPYYEQRPTYSVEESVRYILSRQATISLEDRIDMERMLLQLDRENYPGCHFIPHPWYPERMRLEVKRWKKFRKWVLKNHRKWVTAIRYLRDDYIAAAKREEEQYARDMEYEYKREGRSNVPDDNDTDDLVDIDGPFEYADESDYAGDLSVREED